MIGVNILDESLLIDLSDGRTIRVNYAQIRTLHAEELLAEDEYVE